MFKKLSEKIASIFTNKKLTPETLEELEEALIVSDISFDVVSEIMEKIRRQKFERDISKEQIQSVIKQEFINILKPSEVRLDVSKSSPFSMVLIGVNGSGKTTTIGKLANRFILAGWDVSVVACDTFRLSATEQLKEWTDRVGARLFSRDNADPSGLAYDGYNQARAAGSDVIMIDTAGRLSNNESLMSELQKIIRTVKKVDENAPTKTILVLDGNGGQNSLVQMEKFSANIKIDGLIITKTEGSAKSGFVISLAKKYHMPIYFTTNGEQVDNIREFNAVDFVENLF